LKYNHTAFLHLKATIFLSMRGTHSAYSNRCVVVRIHISFSIHFHI
jgi:hypothetical protein